MLFPKQYDVSRDLADVADGASSSSRQAGGQDPNDRHQKQARRVVVDLREFRSELPSLIHRANIDIVPVTLEVGDYVLTPEICVERKSVSDLIGSLGSGRLYSQAKAMCGVYEKPLLLIEFDPDKPFGGGRAGFPNELRSQEVASKLSLLTLHFPQLRIIWSQSPHQTTEIFDDLKFNKPEPDVLTAQAMTADREGSDSEDSPANGNSTADAPADGKSAADSFNNRNYAEMLQRLPGINAKNSHSIARRVKTIKELCNKTFAELRELLGNDSAALKLHNLLNETCRIQGPTTDGKNSDAADQPQTSRKAYRRKR